MATVITNDNSDILHQETFRFPEEKLHSPELIEQKQDFKHHFGEVSFQEMYFDGYHIAFGAAEAHENLHIESTEMHSQVSLFFVVHGQFDTSVEGVFARRRFSSLEHNLVYNPSTPETVDVIKQKGIEIAGLSFTKDRFLQMAENNGRVLDKLAQNIAVDKAIYLNKNSNQPITSKMLMVLDEIKHCQFHGGLKKLFLQSKVIELLALQCEQYERAENMRTEVISLSQADREKIYYARDLLLVQLQEPPSLQELSRLAGLNEFKLKNGFRQVFDNTVYGYLNDHRMEHARKEVQNGQKTLGEIAYHLGYSSPQHFSNAFRKKFGISPLKMRH